MPHISQVPQQAGIRWLDPATGAPPDFAGADTAFIVADVVFATPYPASIARGELRIVLGTHGVILAAPLAHTDPEAVRLYLIVPASPPPPSTTT